MTRRADDGVPLGATNPPGPYDIAEGGLDDERVVALLAEHLADMRAHSPEGSMHALTTEGLDDPRVTFWTLRDSDHLLGCVALRELDRAHGEIKSMRTAAGHTGRGVASALLTHLVARSAARGYRRLSLETGAAEHYRRAIALYERHGFHRCGPFGPYRPDPHSVFMTRELDRPGPDHVRPRFSPGPR